MWGYGFIKRIFSCSSCRKEYENLKGEYERLKAEREALSVSFDALKNEYTSLVNQNEHYYRLAYNDGLTELPNKSAIIEIIDKVINGRRENEKLVLVHIDLDNFKIVNDTLGHSNGDELLLEVSRRINGILCDEDCLGRYGSDEFIIFSRNVESIHTYDSKIKDIMRVFDKPYIIAGKEIFLTISMGLVILPDNADSAKTMMMNADLAMYEAKKTGRNTYCYYSDILGKRYSELNVIQAEITRALMKNEFEVHYQSIVNINSNATIGYEAFVRWNHPKKGLLLPEQFIDATIDTGQIIAIGRIVLEDVCKQLKIWTTENITIPLVSVNFAKRQFYDNDFTTMIRQMLKKYEVSGDMIEIEIKEDTIMADLQRALKIVNELKEQGINIVIDNFGTNCSSISCLKTLPVSKIKIDKSYLDSAMIEECDRVTIASLISIADSHGITCVVEGVECGEQIEFLRTINCHNVQGFLFGKPEPKNVA